MSWTEDWLWPKVDLRRKAQNAIEEGFWAACFVAAFAAAFALIAVLRDAGSVDFYQLGLAGLFAGLAFGIRKHSRFAAICALLLYVLQRIMFWAPGFGPYQALSFLFVLAFVNCIRGTFAYHKCPPLPASIPSVEQSFQKFASEPSKGEKGPDAT